MSAKTFPPNKYLNHFINPRFQGVNRLFVLSFENKNDRISHSHYLPKVEMLWLMVVTFLYQPINGMNKTDENNKKNCYRSRRWLYNGLFVRSFLFQRNYKLIAIDLSKQQALDVDPRAIQQINFDARLDRNEGGTLFFITKQVKLFLNFHRET